MDPASRSSDETKNRGTVRENDITFALRRGWKITYILIRKFVTPSIFLKTTLIEFHDFRPICFLFSTCWQEIKYVGEMIILTNSPRVLRAVGCGWKFTHTFKEEVMGEFLPMVYTEEVSQCKGRGWIFAHCVRTQCKFPSLKVKVKFHQRRTGRKSHNDVWLRIKNHVNEEKKRFPWKSFLSTLGIHYRLIVFA